MEKRVLVVEDDRSLRPVLFRMLEKINPDAVVDWAGSAEDAFELLKRKIRKNAKEPYDLILSDVWLEGDRSGLDLLNACRQARLKSKVVLTSGHGAVNTAVPFLPKPITFSALERTVGPIIADPESMETAGKFIDIVYWILISWILVAILIAASATPIAPSRDSFGLKEVGKTDLLEKTIPQSRMVS